MVKGLIESLFHSLKSINSFIHSFYFYSTSSSPLLLKGTPDTARIPCRSFTPKHHRQLAQGPCVAARAGFKPATLWTKGVEFTMSHHAPKIYVCSS